MCPLLTSVYLESCHRINDESVQRLAQNCKYLQTLSLSCTESTPPYIHDQSILVIAENCPDLR